MQGQERSNEHGEVHLQQVLRTEPDARPSGLKWVGWGGVEWGVGRRSGEGEGEAEEEGGEAREEV